MKRIIAAVISIAIIMTAVTVYADGIKDVLAGITLGIRNAKATYNGESITLEQRRFVSNTSPNVKLREAYRFLFCVTSPSPLSSFYIEIPIDAAAGDSWTIDKDHLDGGRYAFSLEYRQDAGHWERIVDYAVYGHALEGKEDHITFTITTLGEKSMFGSIEAVYDNGANRIECSFNGLIDDTSLEEPEVVIPPAPEPHPTTPQPTTPSPTVPTGPTWHWEEKKVDCPSCVGGVCPICHGTGTYRLYGQSSPCPRKCPSCGGNGYIMQKVYVLG